MANAVGLGVKGSEMAEIACHSTPFLTNPRGEIRHATNTAQVQKDMRLALEMGRSVDVTLPTTAVTNEFVTAAHGRGSKHEDLAISFQVLAHMSGLNQ